MGQLATPETSLLVKIREDIGHVEESPPLLPDGQEVRQGCPLKELDVEVDNAIKSSREQLVSAPLCLEDVAKLGHVSRELVHSHKVRHSRDPDLLQTLRSWPAKDHLASSQWPGHPPPELVHRSPKGFLAVESDSIKLGDWLHEEGSNGLRVNP
jgi:hypothetical protein